MVPPIFCRHMRIIVFGFRPRTKQVILPLELLKIFHLFLCFYDVPAGTTSFDYVNLHFPHLFFHMSSVVCAREL